MNSISFGNPNDVTSSTNPARWARISGAVQQTYNNLSSVPVTFQTVTQSNPALGNLASNAFTFNGTYRLLVSTHFQLGSNATAGPGYVTVYGRKNGVTIADSVMEMLWTYVDEMEFLSTSFVIDVVAGDTYDVLSSSNSSTRFGLGLSGAQCKCVQFTQI